MFCKYQLHYADIFQKTNNNNKNTFKRLQPPPHPLTSSSGRVVPPFFSSKWPQRSLVKLVLIIWTSRGMKEPYDSVLIEPISDPWFCLKRVKVLSALFGNCLTISYASFGEKNNIGRAIFTQISMNGYYCVISQNLFCSHF